MRYSKIPQAGLGELFIDLIGRFDILIASPVAVCRSVNLPKALLANPLVAAFTTTTTSSRSRRGSLEAGLVSIRVVNMSPAPLIVNAHVLDPVVLCVFATIKEASHTVSQTIVADVISVCDRKKRGSCHGIDLDAGGVGGTEDGERKGHS
jgi:hypothetical protein